jgi:putative aldouronate transport system substrate-binding protein
VQNPLEGAAASRRSVLSLLGLGAIAAAGGGSLAACSEKTGGQGTVTGVEQSNPLLPNYIKFEAVKPDLRGTPPVADGYRNYPSSLVQAVSAAPGKGSTISTMTPYWGPVPPGPGSNQYLDKINQLLGAKLNPNVKDGNTYIDVLNATLQARDVPDVLVIPSWNVNDPPVPRPNRHPPPGSHVTRRRQRPSFASAYPRPRGA